MNMESDTGPCEGFQGSCLSTNGKRAPIMTAYVWDGKGKDPNESPILCPCCTGEWVAHWEEMWQEYYSGLR